MGINQFYCDLWMIIKVSVCSSFGFLVLFWVNAQRQPVSVSLCLTSVTTDHTCPSFSAQFLYYFKILNLIHPYTHNSFDDENCSSVTEFGGLRYSQLITNMDNWLLMIPPFGFSTFNQSQSKKKKREREKALLSINKSFLFFP